MHTVTVRGLDVASRGQNSEPITVIIQEDESILAVPNGVIERAMFAPIPAGSMGRVRSCLCGAVNW